MFKPNKTYVFALGGLGEVGKNMYCIMHNDEIVIIDAGVIFPEENLRGIDYVLPDFEFLKQNESKIKTLVITHGHEDHIGAIPFLLQSVNIPTIFAPNQAYALIRKKLEERNIPYKGLRPYKSDDKLKYKNFEISFFDAKLSEKTIFSIFISSGISITNLSPSAIKTPLSSLCFFSDNAFISFITLFWELSITAI